MGVDEVVASRNFRQDTRWKMDERERYKTAAVAALARIRSQPRRPTEDLDALDILDARLLGISSQEVGDTDAEWHDIIVVHAVNLFRARLCNGIYDLSGLPRIAKIFKAYVNRLGMVPSQLVGGLDLECVYLLLMALAQEPSTA